MPRSKPHKPKGQGEIVPPSNRRDRILELLKIQLETFPQKELTPGEIERWVMDLEPYRMEAIEFAFEEHRLLALFFPLPSQILDICETWHPPEAFPRGCSVECKTRHHKGYGSKDVLRLWGLYTTKRATLNRPLNDPEVEQLYNVLDKERGRSPEWRTTA